MQRISSSEASGFNRLAAASIGAFATAVALLLAGLPAAAEAGPIAPHVVNPQVVTAAPVTPYVAAPSVAPTDPVASTSQAEAPVPMSPAPTAVAAPATDAPEAAQNSPDSASTTSHPKTPAEKQKELLEELRALLRSGTIPGIPDSTSYWSVFDRVMAVVREYFCPRYTWRGATANVENTYEGGSCF